MSVRSSDPARIASEPHAARTAGFPPPAAVPHDVPFTRVQPSPEGVAAVAAAVAAGDLKAGGPATARCVEVLREQLGAPGVLMVDSCTAALELSALLLEIGAGDEVIMPSFGYASAANAFALRGAVPVFVDIVPGTFAIEPAAVREAITERTRAIVVVHYAGVAADMESLLAISEEHGIPIVEDAAQAIGATFQGRPLGTLGALGAFSYDATKNVTCGAGGTLIVNDPALVERAEWLRDCGTDRAGFMRGTKSRYEWVDVGTNAALNELAAAYLEPQLRAVPELTATRRKLWDRYHGALAAVERDGLLDRPVTPAGAEHNAHAYVITLPAAGQRPGVIAGLAARGVQATFHFVPLHSAPAGLQRARSVGSLDRTTDLAGRLLRLPLWNDMTDDHVDHVVAALNAVLRTDTNGTDPS